MLPRPSKQIKLDFDKLTRKDLKPVIDSFIKAGLDVYEVEATNKGKREAGILVKSFSFTFKDGQTLQVRVKVDGVIFQCKINKKVVPIRYVDDFTKAIEEIKGILLKNAEAFKKALAAKEKRAAKQVAEKSLRSSTLKKVLSQRERLAVAVEEGNNLEATVAELQRQLDDLNAQIATKKATIQTTQNDLVAAQEKETYLRNEIAQYDKAA